MRGVVSIGECMIELSGSGGDGWRMGFGGDTLNTLWAIRAISGDQQPANYLTAFGDDPFSRDQIAFLHRNGIGIGTSVLSSGVHPGLYAITLDGAERSFTYWRGESAARRLADDPEALARGLDGQGLIYFSGVTLAILQPAARRTLIDAIAAARATGSRVAFDANYRPRLWKSADEARDIIAAALSITDIALPTFPDEHMLAGDASPAETAERLVSAGVGEIVVKDGSNPALVRTGEEVLSVPAVKVAAIDTTGAGDSFNGGYLAARLAGHPPAEAARHAHNVAAAVVQVRGALAPFDVLRAAFEA